MKKNQYIVPTVEITTIVIESHLMQNSVTSVAGLDGVTKGSGDFVGGEAEVKRPSYNVWDDDWSE